MNDTCSNLMENETNCFDCMACEVEECHLALPNGPWYLHVFTIRIPIRGMGLSDAVLRFS